MKRSNFKRTLAIGFTTLVSVGVSSVNCQAQFGGTGQTGFGVPSTTGAGGLGTGFWRRRRRWTGSRWTWGGGGTGQTGQIGGFGGPGVTGAAWSTTAVFELVVCSVVHRLRVGLQEQV